jgi:RNA polymerase sigma factor (sigma-70 family)
MCAQPATEEPSGSDSLFSRARDGDPAACRELFQTFYPKVKRVISRRLTARSSLRSLYDSADFASDVFKSFVAKWERYEFPNQDALVAFLTEEALRKLIDGHRRHHGQKRNIERERPIGALHDEANGDYFASADPTPSQVVQALETHDRVVAGLSHVELRIIDLRTEGYSNEEIADKVGWGLRKVQRFLKDRFDTVTASETGANPR